MRGSLASPANPTARAVRRPVFRVRGAAGTGFRRAFVDRSPLRRIRAEAAGPWQADRELNIPVREFYNDINAQFSIRTKRGIFEYWRHKILFGNIKRIGVGPGRDRRSRDSSIPHSPRSDSPLAGGLESARQGRGRTLRRGTPGTAVPAGILPPGRRRVGREERPGWHEASFRRSRCVIWHA